MTSSRSVPARRAALGLLVVGLLCAACPPALGAANRLAGAASPYLRQHAGNPVDWYPWGPEALERARAENRPIFLSIGYASCYWCHVMARQVFGDPALAGLMNAWFINIKVDREELPDLDALTSAGEGVYYSWSRAELGEALGPAEASLLEPLLGFAAPPALADGRYLPACPWGWWRARPGCGWPRSRSLHVWTVPLGCCSRPGAGVRRLPSTTSS